MIHKFLTDEIFWHKWYLFFFLSNYYIPLSLVTTHLFPTHLLSTPWKHQNTLRFSDVFRGWRRGLLGTNELTKVKYQTRNCETLTSIEKYMNRQKKYLNRQKKSTVSNKVNFLQRNLWRICSQPVEYGWCWQY